MARILLFVPKPHLFLYHWRFTSDRIYKLLSQKAMCQRSKPQTLCFTGEKKVKGTKFSSFYHQQRSCHTLFPVSLFSDPVYIPLVYVSKCRFSSATSVLSLFVPSASCHRWCAQALCLMALMTPVLSQGLHSPSSFPSLSSQDPESLLKIFFCCRPREPFENFLN